jgi:hypothetical protein
MRSIGNLALFAAVDLHHADVGDTVLDGNVGDLSAVRWDVGAVGRAVRVLRGQAELDVLVPLGQPPKVFAVAIDAVDVPVATEEDDRLAVRRELRHERLGMVRRQLARLAVRQVGDQQSIATGWAGDDDAVAGRTECPHVGVAMLRE